MRHEDTLLRFIAALLFVLIAALALLYAPGLRPPQALPSANDAFVVKHTDAKMDRAIDAFAAEIRSGTLPPLTDDAIIDRSMSLYEEDARIVVSHAETTAQLTRILGLLKRAPETAQGPQAFRIRLYDDRFISKMEGGAFALPGGTLYIGSRTVLDAASEAEIASVIAHEMSHVLLRHNAQLRLYRKNMTRISQRMFQNAGMTRSDIAAAMTAWTVCSSEIVETIENEADDLGQLLLRQAHYDDEALARVLDRLGGAEARRDRILERSRKQNSNAQGKEYIISSPLEQKSLQEKLKKHLER